MMAGVVALALLATSAAGVAARSPRVSRAPASNTFVWAVSENPDSLVPEMGYLLVDYITTDVLMYDGLVRLGLNGQWQPDLATKWHTNANGTQWTFYLRHGVRWNDGQPFTAADVVETWKFNTNPAIKHSYVTGWNLIKSVATPNQYEVVFNMSQPLGQFLPDIGASAILPAHVFAHLTPTEINDYKYPSAAHPVGTGAYMLKKWVQNSTLTLVPNPYYWGPKPKISKIVLEVIPDTTTQELDLESHAVNMATVLPQYVAQAKHWSGVTLYHAINADYELVQLDEMHFLKDLTVRRALNLDTPKSAIVSKIMKGQAVVAYGDQVPGGIWYDPKLPHPGYNPSEALKMLLADGFKKVPSSTAPAGFWLYKGGKRLSVPIWAIAGSTAEDNLAQVEGESWERIGVYAPVGTLSISALFAQTGPQFNGKDEALIYSWDQGPFPNDQVSFDWQKYPCLNANSATDDCSRYNNPVMSKLTQEGAAAVNVAKAKAIYDKIQQLEISTVPIIFLFWYDSYTGVSSNLHGFKETVYGTTKPWTWSLN
jgi:peptide/nickel transport system substrate-binding protein